MGIWSEDKSVATFLVHVDDDNGSVLGCSQQLTCFSRAHKVLESWKVTSLLEQPFPFGRQPVMVSSIILQVGGNVSQG